MRILIVEDDVRSASYLARGLKECGFIVDRAADGELGLSLAREAIYDLLVVDRMLPGLDGIDLVRAVRADGLAIPILMLSALSSSSHRIEGLKAGCDDYLVKPYAFSELMARIEAILRRSKTPIGDSVLAIDDFTLNVGQRMAIREGKTIQLQLREALLLQMLVRNAGQVVTRSMLLEAAWDYDFEPRGNIVDMHIHRIRKKIDDGFEHTLIRTVPGAGYMFGTVEAGSLPNVK